MADSILVTFITPVYNAMPYLPACINSLLAQEGSDIEFLFVDDGSTDSSGKILGQCAAQDYRVRLIKQENAGVSAARNAALAKARGEYIIFVDADDMISKRLMNDLRPYMKQESDLLLFSWTSFYKPDGSDIYEGKSTDKMRECTDEERRILVTNTLCPTLYIDKTSLNFRYDNGVKCAVFHKSIIQKENICFPMGLSHGEDAAFKMTYLRYAQRILIADNLLYFYRSNPTSAMQKYNPNIENVIKNMLDTFSTVLSTRYADDPDLTARFLGTVIRQSELYFTLYLFHKDCPLTQEEKKEKYAAFKKTDYMKSAISACDAALLRPSSRMVLEAYRETDPEASYQKMENIFVHAVESGWKGKLKKLLIRMGLTGKIRAMQRKIRRLFSK